LSAYAVFHFFSFQCILLSGSSGRTGEPGEDVVDIDTGLVICNASHENIFLGKPKRFQ